MINNICQIQTNCYSIHFTFFLQLNKTQSFISRIKRRLIQENQEERIRPWHLLHISKHMPLVRHPSTRRPLLQRKRHPLRFLPNSTRLDSETGIHSASSPTPCAWIQRQVGDLGASFASPRACRSGGVAEPFGVAGVQWWRQQAGQWHTRAHHRGVSLGAPSHHQYSEGL